MWDSNSPLQLLKSMPKKLSKENLEKIQLVIEADKYKNSLINGFDLCGMYAPFCKGCKKSSIYPCAISYVNMMKAQGMDIEIDAKPIGYAPRPSAASPIAAEVKPEKQAEEEIAVAATVREESPAVGQIAEEAPAVQEAAVAKDNIEENKVEEVRQLNEPAKSTAKRKIRIAVARKKI